MDGHENNSELPDLSHVHPEVVQMLLRVRQVFSRHPNSLTYVTPVRVPQIAQLVYPWLFQGPPVNPLGTHNSSPEVNQTLLHVRQMVFQGIPFP